MSDFLQHLAAQAFDRSPVIRPRLPGLYELDTRVARPRQHVLEVRTEHPDLTEAAHARQDPQPPLASLSSLRGERPPAPVLDMSSTPMPLLDRPHALAPARAMPAHLEPPLPRRAPPSLESRVDTRDRLPSVAMGVTRPQVEADDIPGPRPPSAPLLRPSSSDGEPVTPLRTATVLPLTSAPLAAPIERPALVEVRAERPPTPMLEPAESIRQPLGPKAEEPSPIQVTIGRVEVRALLVSEPSIARVHSPDTVRAPSLEDYLARRSRGTT